MQLLELWPMAKLALKQRVKAHGPLVILLIVLDLHANADLLFLLFLFFFFILFFFVRNRAC